MSTTRSVLYIKRPLDADKKHSIIFVPAPGEDTPQTPAPFGSVYINRLALPNQAVTELRITVEVVK